MGWLAMSGKVDARLIEAICQDQHVGIRHIIGAQGPDHQGNIIAGSQKLDPRADPLLIIA